MSTTSRRRFLKQASTTGVACSASLLFGRSLSARAASEPVRIYVDSRRTISPIDRNLFGSFLEHLGRAIYEGISDPGSKLSDSNGFRKDVMQEISPLGVPIIRYPGGNFVSGYKLAGRRWPQTGSPASPRPRLELFQFESIRHQRISRLVQSRRHRAAHGLELRHWHCRASRGSRGVL